MAVLLVAPSRFGAVSPRSPLGGPELICLEVRPRPPPRRAWAAGRDGEPSAREGRAVKNLKNDHIWGGGSVTDYTEGEGGETYRIWQAERGSETDRTRSRPPPISPNDQLSVD